MSRALTAWMTVGALAALAACATAPAPQMGATPDAVAPRLVDSGQTDAKTGATIYRWDRPAAFGVVIGERKTAGDAACLSASPNLEAIGYHPAALDEKGQPLPGGGYYCAAKAGGDAPAAMAPRLVSANGSSLPSWDHPAAFGRVPDGLQAKGDAACMASGAALHAVGYHPAAIGTDGKPLSGGGFFCARKKNGEAPAATPPRLVTINGITGWDHPAAFGAVPPALQSQGDAVCARANPSLRAIGYHPGALNQNSAPIGGGGYFCTARTTARA